MKVRVVVYDYLQNVQLNYLALYLSVVQCVFDYTMDIHVSFTICDHVKIYFYCYKCKCCFYSVINCMNVQKPNLSVGQGNF